ncbi:Protein ECT2 [Caenorhabditis elegans]|uniref:Protein ECT2 n=1 Tax=Caenorhabditis elegans TaxID=6239 RepID=Q22590_CAEEL|nr:Protein ECT2 [Caenorhabditis elegans]CAA86788.1 Protein ECT2 [Caenorhabditis elegans]|eukprot:NP_496319.1 ECT2 (mammalian Rho GEF) homolog [Caenorhabditis elegans]
MDVSMLQSPQKRIKTIQKLAVSKKDVHDFKDIFEMLEEQKEKRNINIIQYDSLDDLSGDWSEYTFFCGNFDSDLFRTLTKHQETQALFIIGASVLKNKLLKNEDLMTLRAARPLYCELMKDVTMKLAAEVPNKRELVDLVHYMGGSVRKDTVSRTNVFIAAKVEAKVQSISLVGVPTMRADWVTECWKHRDDSYFDVMEPCFVDKHRLGVFEGLSLFFHGFKQTEIDDMLRSLENTGGKLAPSPTLATHVVYNPDNDEVETLAVSSNQVHVTKEWFWVSLHRGCCAIEDNFALPTGKLHRKPLESSSVSSPIGKSLRSQNSRSLSSMRDCSVEGPTSLNMTPDYIYSNDDVENSCKSPRQPSKRLRVCMEMVETEKNYLSLLKLVVKFKEALECEISHNEFMSRSDVAMMFGKLDPILELHERIFARLTVMSNEANTLLTVVNGKKNDDKNLDFAQVWIDAKEEMKKAYPQYINSYDTIKRLFDKQDRENSKFHTFCKAKESNPEFHRLKLTDLMVKPVQRLPSVILLLKEMAKKSDSKLKNNAEEAAKAIDEVLKTANKTREKNDNFISHLSKFTDIENVPPILVAANRMFIRELVVSPIASTSPGLQQFAKMKLFLFHDVLIITKIRSEKNTMQRLARHASFASLHSRQRRPYRYIDQIQLNTMRSAFRIRAPDEIAKCLELQQQNGSTKPNVFVWCLIHRDEQGGDIDTVFESNDDEEVRDFLDDIHVKILSDCGRFFYSSDPSDMNEINDAMVSDMTTRYFRNLCGAKPQYGHGSQMNITEWSHNESFMPPPQSQSRMRRAFSNAQLTLATTLGFGRNQSRNNLGQINENTTFLQSPRVSCDPAALANMTSVGGLPGCQSESESTPKRGIRSRLTSTTFLGGRHNILGRNTSMRRQATGFAHSEKELPRSKTSSYRVTDI